MRLEKPTIRSLLLTSLAMLAFAGNSLLCRAALRDPEAGPEIDPATFTAVRLVCGALVLLLILSLSRRSSRAAMKRGGWWAAAALFLYAACFSYAYLSLDAGTGALILFGFVQATMILHALTRGERPGLADWGGWSLAAIGLVWLLAPGASAPNWAGATLMATAGIAWGGYSLLGKRQSQPLEATAANFSRALVFVPLLALPALLTGADSFISAHGLLLAITSGALTSGLGYVLWYAAVSLLSSMQAALVQLSVPALAAAGGVMLLGETPTLRLAASGLLILGGMSLALARRRTTTPHTGRKSGA
jgi:drug/metabolite transporter (DMT)-like permease